MELQAITLSEGDFSRLSALVDSGNPLAATLEQELERAIVLPDRKMPADFVRMYSTVSYRDLSTGAISRVMLVYPHEAAIALARVSVLAPIGAALLGLRVGQTTQWTLPNDRTVGLEVLEIVHADSVAGE